MPVSARCSAKVLATSVVRSVRQGQSHGGLHLVDLESGSFEQVVDWDRLDIDWAGRGKDRGLRGIAFHGGLTYVAASDEILAFDHGFRIVKRFRNAYLAHCHEICVDAGLLWMTSTGFDVLLALDLRTGRFVRGLGLRHRGPGPWLARLFPGWLPVSRPFDPEGEGGPAPGDTLHLNMVHVDEGGIWCSGTGLRRLLRVEGDRVTGPARIPASTHNARPYRRGVLMHDTARDRVLWSRHDGSSIEAWPLVRYDEATLLHRDVPEDHARQAFGRGLCLDPEGRIVAGSSPATISVYGHGREEPLLSVNLSMDVRNAIHGLEIYPF